MSIPEDNWHHLGSFCGAHDRLSFVIRRFEAERCPTNSKFPMKTVCGIFATRNFIERDIPRNAHCWCTHQQRDAVMIGWYDYSAPDWYLAGWKPALACSP
jgi:hypothetical protein